MAENLEQQQVPTEQVSASTIKEKDAYDKYLDKRKRNYKITLIVAVALAFVLSLTLLITSCIKVDIRPNILKTNPDNIKIISDDFRAEYGKNDENYENVIGVYKDSFKLSFISALFSGQLGSYKIKETLNTFDPSNASSITSIVGEQYIELSYNEEKTLKYSNGDIRYSVYNAGTPLTYDYVYFPICKDNNYEEVTFHFAVRGSISEDSTSGVVTRDTQITVKTSMYNLIERFEDLAKTK